MPKSISSGPALSTSTGLSVEGFTLVELLIVAMIIAVLVALILPNLGTFSQSQSLTNAANQLETALRTAQNNATSGVTCTSSSGTVQKAVNWYVTFPSFGSYQIGDNCSSASLTPTPMIISTSTLPAGIVFGAPPPSGAYFGTDTSCSFDPGTGFIVSFTNISGAVSFSFPPGVVGCPSLGASKVTIPLVLNGSTTIKVVVESGGSIYLSSN